MREKGTERLSGWFKGGISAAAVCRCMKEQAKSVNVLPKTLGPGTLLNHKIGSEEPGEKHDSRINNVQKRKGG